MRNLNRKVFPLEANAFEEGPLKLFAGVVSAYSHIALDCIICEANSKEPPLWSFDN